MLETFKFFATTAKGMEPILADELRALGLENVLEGRAGASFEGPLESGYRACLWSRVANRILLPLKKFPAPNPEKLYGGVKGIKWSDHLGAENTLAVDFSSSHSAITHTHFGALKVKDAIVDQLRSVLGSRPSVNLERPDIRVNVYLHEDTAQVSLDLSGESMHRRGYRGASVPAPLKENLAAGILSLAGWAKRAELGESLIDPMCGSGTLPIEAAWIAARIAPGLGRVHHGFTAWRGHQETVWSQLCEEARDLQIRDTKKLPKMVGYDQDYKAVRLALEQVERAGMRGVVHIEKREFSALEPTEVPGVIVMNPPYGERLGETEALMPLYSEMGDIFKKRFAGWNAYVLTSNPELAKAVGLKPSRKFVLFNGAIECRLLRFELFQGSRREDPRG